MIYLLVGPDRYLLERELKRILDEVDPDGLNTTRYEKSTSIGEVGNAVATAGFFGDGRVIVAEGVMARASGAGKAKKAEADEIDTLFKSVAPGNTLILVDPEIGTVPAGVKKAAGSEAIQFGGRVPRGHDLVEWAQRQVAEMGGQIEPRNINAILDRLFPGTWREANRNPAFDLPPDLLLLSNELAKLVVAADSKEINARHVRELVPLATGEDLFPFIDAVVSGNAAGAFKLLSGDETDDDTASRYLNQLGSRAERGQALAASGMHDMAEVGKKVGATNPSSIQKTFSRTSPESFANIVLESDRRLKTGKTRSPSEQLQDVIVRQARKTRGQ
jgi:DNA polymerase III delta subunit